MEKDKSQLKGELKTLLKDYKKSGSKATLGRIVQLMEKPVYRYCLFLTKNSNIAEELMQEAFYKAMGKLSDLRHGEELLAWVTTIARNLFLDQVRSAEGKLISKTSTELEDHVLPVNEVDRELLLSVQDTLALISNEDREVLLLVEVQGLSYEEAGKVLNLKPGSVGSRLFRAKQAFVEAFNREVA